MIGDIHRAIILDYIIEKNMDNISVANLLLDYINLTNLYEVRKKLENE